MAELEAVFDDKATRSRKGWRHPLPDNAPKKIGRVPGEADWWMPDPLISSFHATVTWDGSKLTVEERPDPKPVNRIYFKRQPVGKAALGVGEQFVIGNTVFTVHDQPPTAPADMADAAVPSEATFTRDQLKETRHRDPGQILSALETLPDILRMATNQEVLFRQMVQTVLGALPLASSAAVVEVDAADKDSPVRSRYHQQKLSLAGGGDRKFAPSRKLVRRALVDRRESVLYVWEKGDPSSSLSMAGNSGITIGAHVNTQQGYPWAICTPFEDESGLGLYVDGLLQVPPSVRGGPVDDELKDYLKFTKLVASLIEATMKAHDQERQLSVYGRFLPARLKSIPFARMQDLLRPRVTPVTVLFCDIRGSVKIAAGGGTDIEGTWKRVSAALDDMTTTITMHGGVVAGFQGDAVMAFWGWPLPDDQKDQVEKACRAALRIRERFDTEGFYAHFQCGIGLAHGPAMAGRLGAHDLSKIDVFGPVANLASRLESATKQFGVRILIDPAVANGLRAMGNDRMIGRIRELGRYRPVGMDAGVMFSELLPMVGQPGGEMTEKMRRGWEESLRKFEAGDWAAAKNRIEMFFGDDKAGKKIIDFMAATDFTVPQDWKPEDGIPLDAK